MLLKTKGVAVNINPWIVGRVTRDIHCREEGHLLIIERHILSNDLKSFDGVLTDLDWSSPFELPMVHKIPSLEHLQEGDVVVAHNDGVVNTLYRVNSFHNTILATERCNSNCLMCSQPPRDRNDVPRLYEIYQQAIPLIPKNCAELGVSGGEPTMMGRLFFQLLGFLKIQLPDTEIHVLTNGRSFAWHQMAERLTEINHYRVMLGVPLYADYYQLHDYIVQSRNAFDQTVLGLHNLARYGQRVEIRIVLHKLSIPRLTRLARYIYKNFPFAEHIAFMGLEYIGYTPHNIDKLWVDPADYQYELSEAVEFLGSQGMNVSIYNSQLCVLPKELWPYCRKSISDWKNSYLPECSKCAKMSDCGGLFTWNLKMHSNYIKAIEQCE